MLRNALAVLLLVSHVNFFMFIPQLDEQDAYDAKGCRINDVNSLAEYVNDVILQNNKPRPDEDDDTARFFHIVKLRDCLFPRRVIIPAVNPVNALHLNYPFYNNDKKPVCVFYDVVTPPPRIIV